MNTFELVPCNICNSHTHTTIYQSKQYANSSLGNMDISLVICNHCNFIFQNPQLTHEALTIHYTQNSSGETYTQKGIDTRTTNLLQERISFISDFIQNNPISNICEVGGGKGLLLDSIPTNQNVQKFLIEPSNAITQLVNKNIIKINKFVQQVDSKAYRFDFIMCISALEHFKNPRAILEKFHQLLSNDGALCIEVPNSLKPYNTFAEFFSYEHLNHFTPDTINKILDYSGFYPVKIEQSSMVPNIRVIAKKKDLHINKDQIFDVFKIYTQNKIKLKTNLKTTIEKLKHNNQLQNLAIYGAGDHTKFILESFDLLDNVVVFIDSDPKKWDLFYYNKKIIAPKDILKYSIQNILISSYDFEKEIYATLQDIISDNINIIRLYNNQR